MGRSDGSDTDRTGQIQVVDSHSASTQRAYGSSKALAFFRLMLWPLAKLASACGVTVDVAMEVEKEDPDGSKETYRAAARIESGGQTRILPPKAQDD